MMRDISLGVRKGAFINDTDTAFYGKLGEACVIMALLKFDTHIHAHAHTREKNTTTPCVFGFVFFCFCGFRALNTTSQNRRRV